MVRITLALLLFCACAFAQAPAPITFTRPAYSISFSPGDGSILAFRQANRIDPLVQTGPSGLWQLRFADNTTLSASEFSPDNAGRRLVIQQDAATLTFLYTSDAADVTITATPSDTYLDIRGQVTPHGRVVLDFAFPTQLRFDPATLTRFIAPDAGLSVGTAFLPAFFRPQPADNPAGWEPTVVGPANYRSLYGGEVTMRPVDDPPVTLRPGRDAAAWLTPALLQTLSTQVAIVNRPPAEGQADLIIADSANGPLLSASHLGGQGLLWRFGGMITENQSRLALDLASPIFRRLATDAPQSRRKIGVLALTRGPAEGAWCAIPVGRWADAAQAAANVANLQFNRLTTPAQLQAALQDDDYLLIVNPYGEWLPVSSPGRSQSLVQSVGRFVRAGGNWLEVGGYPFFAELLPTRYLQRRLPYPNAFADFVQIDASGGSLAVYGIQPIRDPRNTSTILVPAQLEWGAEEQGGYFEHTFNTYVRAGQSWSSPTLRLVPGQSAPANLAAYTRANGLTRKLDSKLPAPILQKLKDSVLVFYNGSAAEKTAHLHQLPVPSLIHFADYLQGGFDKQYPDHLPPSPGFGTPEEFRTFLQESRQLGHLTMPYTNSTWWCDHPRGATFLKAGEEPLLKDLSGKPVYERYDANDGWTITMWHPAVQAANRATITAFTKDYPVDLLFEDQLGARSWGYDTNPASPTPYAYGQGMLAHTATDAAALPVSTECGWDRVAEYATQLCGLSWDIVPTENAPSWRRFLHERYPEGTWEIFPLAQYIAHDKVSMVHHDLGQFITNPQTLSWTLGLGFGLSYRTQASALDSDPSWLQWLARVQKSVASRYVGQPLTSFTHDRGKSTLRDGVLHAGYGRPGYLSITANLEPTAQNGIAPYGFLAGAPDLAAGDLVTPTKDNPNATTTYIIEGPSTKADLWLYASADQAVTLPLLPWHPEATPKQFTVTFDGQLPMQVSPRRNTLALITPAWADPALAGVSSVVQQTAPRTWPGPKPAVGVIDLGPGIGPALSPITPQEWVSSLSSSPAIRATGMQVKIIHDPAELAAALKAGPATYLAIINPYGEFFPVDKPDNWRGALKAIRDYTRRGGHWWEVGGYSFYGAISRTGSTWTRTPVEAAGAAQIGLRIAFGETDAAPERLAVTSMGKEWLGPELSSHLGSQKGTTNRGLATGPEAPETLSLVTGANPNEPITYIGGQRLGGVGFLWRIGGFNPDPAVSLPTVAQVINHLYTRPPVPSGKAAARRLYHATITSP